MLFFFVADDRVEVEFVFCDDRHVIARARDQLRQRRHRSSGRAGASRDEGGARLESATEGDRSSAGRNVGHTRAAGTGW